MEKSYDLEKKINGIVGSSSELDILDRFREDVDCFPILDNYHRPVKEFTRTGAYDCDISVNRYTNFFISNENALRIVGDFYRSKGKFYSRGFDSFYRDSKDNLSFFAPKDGNEGETILLNRAKKVITLVPNYTNILKVSILAHEVAHAIDFYYNPEFAFNYTISEISSLFMELVCTDYICSLFGLKKDNLNRKREIHSIMRLQSDNVVCKRIILEIVKKYFCDDKDKILSILSSKGFSIDDVYYHMESPIYKDYTYSFSYLIVMELYSLYLVDPDKALYILKDIILNGSDFNIFSLLRKHGIVLNSSCEDYENKCLHLKREY